MHVTVRNDVSLLAVDYIKCDGACNTFCPTGTILHPQLIEVANMHVCSLQPPAFTLSSVRIPFALQHVVVYQALL